ncbi:hypothetical protein POSPLADRAFT_1031127 [Postia placenta MAD-698-R-SB12]|uniref:Uncharacterized protein n=1 Tax=Postia placenta MAD-698-R-SB12 TaxID=670580 RepID=A0A1X6NB86_9APHY|nr:hypothetical protein POSPLADRAFT_1031127 [Postia placenta MAD-698-R-SB12]OSX65905.1 hypothetical protein POSPLADRAFT_1031127 [Postia placenta MAD-698-R-SB12]
MDSPDTPSPGTSQQTSGSRPWTITSRPSEDSDHSVTSFRVDACRRWVEANINRSFWSPEFVSGGRSTSVDGGFKRYAFRSATLSTEAERSSRGSSRRSSRSCPRFSSGVRGRDVGPSAGVVYVDEPHARKPPAAAPAPRHPPPRPIAALDAIVPVSTQTAPSRRMALPIPMTPQLCVDTAATMPPSPQETSSMSFAATRASPREMHAQTTYSPVLEGRGALALYSSRPSRGMVHRGLHTLQAEDAVLPPDADVLREIQRMLLTGSLGESSHRAFDPHSLDALRYHARTVTSGRSQSESLASNNPHDAHDTLADMVVLLHSQSLMDRTSVFSNIAPEQ